MYLQGRKDKLNDFMQQFSEITETSPDKPYFLFAAFSLSLGTHKFHQRASTDKVSQSARGSFVFFRSMLRARGT